MNPPKGCCDNCKENPPRKVYQSPDIACVNPSCVCHGKGEKQSIPNTDLPESSHHMEFSVPSIPEKQANYKEVGARVSDLNWEKPDNTADRARIAHILRQPPAIPTNKECRCGKPYVYHDTKDCAPIAPTQPEKCCENDLKKVGAGTVPCFNDHTSTPEWDGRFTELLDEIAMGFEHWWAIDKYMLPKVKEFLAREITAAEERGKNMKGSSFREGFMRGRLDTLEAIKEALPKEAWESDGWNMPECCPGDDRASGFNHFRTSVLTIIHKMKEGV